MMPQHLQLTCHARVRSQQRGIRHDAIGAVIKYSDKSERRGRHCWVHWVSRRRLGELGSHTPEGVSTERLDGLHVLVGESDIVTVFRRPGKSSYRRQKPTTRR